MGKSYRIVKHQKEKVNYIGRRRIYKRYNSTINQKQIRPRFRYRKELILGSRNV